MWRSSTATSGRHNDHHDKSPERELAAARPRRPTSESRLLETHGVTDHRIDAIVHRPSLPQCHCRTFCLRQCRVCWLQGYHSLRTDWSCHEVGCACRIMRFASPKTPQPFSKCLIFSHRILPVLIRCVRNHIAMIPIFTQPTQIASERVS